MPGCVFRAFGASFDVEDCLAEVTLCPITVFRKGEARSHVSPGASIHDSSGFHVLVSDSDGDHVPAQIEDAIEFLKRYHGELMAISQRNDVERAYLDFGWNFPVGENASPLQFNLFPLDLLVACGEIGIGLMVSIYGVEDDTK